MSISGGPHEEAQSYFARFDSRWYGPGSEWRALAMFLRHKRDVAPSPVPDGLCDRPLQKLLRRRLQEMAQLCSAGRATRVAKPGVRAGATKFAILEKTGKEKKSRKEWQGPPYHLIWSCADRISALGLDED
jgi:hypothetical protein